MHGTDETPLTRFSEPRAILPPELGGRCLIDSYRIVTRIRRECELTREMCRRQRQSIAEQREFLKGLRQTPRTELYEGTGASADDEGARAGE